MVLEDLSKYSGVLPLVASALLSLLDEVCRKLDMVSAFSFISKPVASTVMLTSLFMDGSTEAPNMMSASLSTLP
jgi:hypothetical protein